MFEPVSLEGYDFAGRAHHWPPFHFTEQRRSAEGRIAIVGRPDVGKKTLVNNLWGWPALKPDANAEHVRPLGLFTLVTPPEDTSNEASVLFHLESADLVIYLVDGFAGIQAEDIRWIARLRVLPGNLLVVFNKRDLVLETLRPEAQARMEQQFARPVLPLSATDQDAVHTQLLPLMLKTCPQLAVPLATEITGLRGAITRQLIRDAALRSLLANLEPGSNMDLMTLLDVQRQLVRQIAHIYGSSGSDDPHRAQWPRLVHKLMAQIEPHAAAIFGARAQRLLKAGVAFAGTWLLGLQTLHQYDSRAPLRWASTLFSRNGHHA